VFIFYTYQQEYKDILFQFIHYCNLQSENDIELHIANVNLNSFDLDYIQHNFIKDIEIKSMVGGFSHTFNCIISQIIDLFEF